MTEIRAGIKFNPRNGRKEYVDMWISGWHGVYCGKIEHVKLRLSSLVFPGDKNLLSWDLPGN